MSIRLCPMFCAGLLPLCSFAMPPLSLEQAIAEKFLPDGSEFSTWASVYARVAERDAVADSKWRSLSSRSEYDAWRQELRERMLKGLGELPERTPLHFRIVRTFERSGYRIDHVVFESMPGVLVPANLFVPTDGRFAKPYPAVVLSCGHACKDADIYLRSCVVLAKRGIVALMFDPYEQGERVEYPDYNCCQNHNLIGLKAMLLGSSMAALRVWDGLRAVDVVESLNYVDASRIGYAGNSGGGTMTALMTAVDTRLKATAPSCYLTSFGYLCRTKGPQDAEQNVFGQLAFGLNHTGYVLLSDAKVAVTGRFDDMFDYGGTVQLMETVRAVANMLGTADHYALNFAQGPHGWTESTIQGTADWMCAWLKDQKELLPLEMPRIRRADFGLDRSADDYGLAEGERGVFRGQRLADMSGSRSIHDVFRDRLAHMRKTARPHSVEETARIAARLAGVRRPGEIGISAIEFGKKTCDGCDVTQVAFVYPDGFALPAALVEPKVSSNASPVLVAGSQGRLAMLSDVKSILATGAPALVLDVSGVGEIGGMRFAHYEATDTPEEGVSIMLYLLGESMPGRRANELICAAQWLKARYGRPVDLVAEGSVAVGAAHAFAAARSDFGKVRLEAPPPSWREFVEHEGKPLPYRYTWCVNGALREYDWTDLLKE